MTFAPLPTLLLISIHPHFIYLIKRYGARSGHQVLVVATVAQALVALRVARPVMLLLHLPAEPHDGWAPLRQLHAHPTTHLTPITVISAWADEARARAEGATYWLWQPVLYADFVSALARV